MLNPKAILQGDNWRPHWKIISKRLILGLYILCTRLHCFNRKTKNIVVLFYFSFYFVLFSFCFTYPYHYWLYWVWRLIYCRTYRFFASHTYEIPFQVIPHQVGLYKLYNHFILVFKNPSWMIQRTGWVIWFQYLNLSF